MDIFLLTLNQIAFLFGLIIVGYLLIKLKVLPEISATVLSKLENNVFVPALVLGTFIENFKVQRISEAWKLLLISFIMAVIAILIAIFSSKLITKDTYIIKIYTYGLSFSNFAFMGNAVVCSMFPDILFEYLVFTLPLWVFIYAWGVPRLLISSSGEKQTFAQSLKSFVNPIFIAMIIGMVIGLLQIPLPDWTLLIIEVSGDCMSPVAMILTGIVIASNPLKKAFANVSIYIVSIIRLVIIPLLFILVASFVEIPRTIYICGLCSLAMPLGLNTIVVPSAYGKDTSVAAGMAVISHLLAIVTIPVIFMFL